MFRVFQPKINIALSRKNSRFFFWAGGFWHWNTGTLEHWNIFSGTFFLEHFFLEHFSGLLEQLLNISILHRLEFFVISVTSYARSGPRRKRPLVLCSDVGRQPLSRRLDSFCPGDFSERRRRCYVVLEPFWAWNRKPDSLELVLLFLWQLNEASAREKDERIAVPSFIV